MMAPHMNPWGPIQAVLVAIGAIAALHVLHHAIHYPLKQTIGDAWVRFRARREKDQYLPKHWKPDERHRTRQLLLDIRARRKEALSDE